MHLYKAILVDDEVFTRKGLIKLIDWEACGFQIVEEADNGEDALMLIESMKPDLVITDIRMPVLDGLELIHKTVSEKRAASPEFIIISGYDDFKYAQRAVRYGVHDFVLKPIDEAEFSATLRKLSGKLRQEREARKREERMQGGAMIEAIIMGEADEALIIEWERRLHLKPNESLYYLFAELNDHHPWRETREEITSFRFMELVRDALQRMAGEGDLFYLHEHRNRIGIIVPGDVLNLFGGNIRTLAETLVREIEVQKGRIFIYAGRKVCRLADIREAYEGAKEALQYKFVYDDSGIVIHDETMMAQPVRYLGMDQGLYAGLIEQIEEMRSDRLRQSIDTLFRDFQEKRFAPEAVKMNIHQCVLGIVKIIRSMDGNEVLLDSMKPIMGWHDLNMTLSELKRLFAAFALESGKYIGDLRKERQLGGIQKMRVYIEEHYQDNISLKSIASRFYMNPVYLGQLFKKTYGVYFNDFLLQIRVNQAKKLLRQTDLRIYEVAERVGFGNPDYFVTQFEKLEKMTPSEYRSRLAKEGQSARTE